VNQRNNKVIGFLFRVLLALAGLIFMASFLVLVLGLVSVWLLRSLWSRLTGQAVRPWVSPVDSQAVWARFYQAPQRASERRANVNDVTDVVEVAHISDITDVEPKRPS
jgi:hypothetical protein